MVRSNFNYHRAKTQGCNFIANEAIHCLLGILFIHLIIYSTIY